jgi:hypothetical protein
LIGIVVWVVADDREVLRVLVFFLGGSGGRFKDACVEFLSFLGGFAMWVHFIMGFSNIAPNCDLANTFINN